MRSKEGIISRYLELVKHTWNIMSIERKWLKKMREMQPTKGRVSNLNNRPKRKKKAFQTILSFDQNKLMTTV